MQMAMKIVEMRIMSRATPQVRTVFTRENTEVSGTVRSALPKRDNLNTNVDSQS
jgi:hypothetical protein